MTSCTPIRTLPRLPTPSSSTATSCKLSVAPPRHHRTLTCASRSSSFAALHAELVKSTAANGQSHPTHQPLRIPHPLPPLSSPFRSSTRHRLRAQGGTYMHIDPRTRPAALDAGKFQLWLTRRMNCAACNLRQNKRERTSCRRATHLPFFQGYGVELAVKNMEYKSIDDKKVSHHRSRTSRFPASPRVECRSPTMARPPLQNPSPKSTQRSPAEHWPALISTFSTRAMPITWCS